jgi:hypothetical protein
LFTMSELPSAVIALLDRCPKAGDGVHQWLFGACAHLHVHCSPEEILALLKSKTEYCGRIVSDKEINDAIAASAQYAWQPNNPGAYLAKYPDASLDVPPNPILSAPAPSKPKWPEDDLGAIQAVVQGGPGLYDLWEGSPLRFGDHESHTEEIIDLLFPGDPLLCCGWRQSIFKTHRREKWRGVLGSCSFIVPSPMLTQTGHRKSDGAQTEHSLQATARRVYLVVEFDFSKFARDGVTPSKWKPLVDEWEVQDTSVADVGAALHLHLAQRLPLVAATHSGGKSLHGWFAAFNRTIKELREFFAYAVSLGADPMTWTRSQFVRMPDGRRENGNRQVTFYFNPKEAVKDDSSIIC